MRNQPKVYGLITLFIKVNFLVAGITLWQLPWVATFFADIPLHQIVGSTIFVVLAYMELLPFFASKAKKPAKQKSNMAEAGLDFIQTS